MTVVITDNPIIHKEQESFLLYQIFDWRMFVNEKDENEGVSNEFILRKRFKTAKLRDKLKGSSKIILITAPSNYKLIYDAIFLKETMKLELVIYSWDSWAKRKKITLNERVIKKMFSEYIQRGYLTKLIYKQISTMNIQRVEQFTALIAINIIKKMKCEPEEIKEYNDLIDTNFIIRLLYSQGFSFRKIIDKLIYHSRKNDISDPFIGTFKFISTTNSLYKKFQKGIIEDNDKSCSIVKTINTLSMFPYTDVLKTLRFMEKNDLISMSKMTTDNIFEDSDLADYSKYILRSSWESVYKLKTFQFAGIFPAINITEDKYSCPICGSSVLRETPRHFFCSDYTCKLFINRIINPGGIKKQVTELELIRLIKHGNTIIKNKIGGYNRFMLQRNGENFKIVPQIESNIKEED